MDTTERIQILRQSGFSPQTVAAILGVDYAEVQEAAVDPSKVPEVGGGGGGGATVSVTNDAEEHVNSAFGNYLSAPTKDLVTVTLTEAKPVLVYAKAQVASPPGDWCTCGLFVDGAKVLKEAGGSASQFQQLILGRTGAAEYGFDQSGNPSDTAPLGGGVSLSLAAGVHTFELRYYGNPCHMRKRTLAVAG